MPCLGGYSLPWNSTLGVHVQRASSGIASITDEMWLPQPHQVAFSVGREGGED